MEKGQSFQQVVLGKLDSYMQKDEIRTIPNTIHKNKLKNVRQDTMKLLEETVGRTLFDINHRKIFFDPPPRVTKINKWDPIKLKITCIFKYMFPRQ